MKKMLLMIIASVSSAGAVEPLEPRAVPSTPRQTLPVSLHPDITTMLVFPEPVSMIVGAGLTDGTTAGLIQFDHRRDSPVVTFRALQNDQPAFAQIISGERIYFCRLGIAERPDSVVTIDAPKKAVADVPVEQVVSQRLIFAEERLRQLVELARSAAILRQVVPDEFKGYQSLLEVSTSNKTGSLETRVDQLHRFPESDSLVIFGTVTNRGSAPVEFQTAALSIRVGDSRVLRPNWILPTEKILKAGESVRVECVVAGDGKGNRLHLSIRNRFSLNLVPPP